MMSTLAHSDLVEIPDEALKPIPPRKLIKIAREAARDAQLIRRVASSFKERMGLKAGVPKFDVEVEENMMANFRIIGDPDLIEQSVGCVIDNAFKYSESDLTHPTIRIHCLLELHSVTLSIMNKPLVGLEIDEDTRENCRQRDWRSDAAKACDADGTGLGLYLVDRIMIAHKGELRIYGTDARGWNKFSLQFPLKPAYEFKRDYIVT